MHYKRSPSATSRWVNCPGSLKLSEGCERRETVYSQEGTLAHSVAEKGIRSGNFLASEFTEDFEMAAAVQVYLDFVQSLHKSYEILVAKTECTLKHKSIPGFGGTADHALIYVENGQLTLHLIDYKHGAGVPVDVVENQQLLSYFLIFDSHYSGLIEQFKATIVQPRAFNGDDVQTWACDRERLAKHHDDVMSSFVDEDRLSLGEHCRWCPAKFICPEQQKAIDEVATDRKSVV